MTAIDVLETAKRLKALADVGLLYSKNAYDNERYHEIQEMSLQLLSNISGNEDLKATFPKASDYPTAKVDIRGLLLSPDGKLLLVQEQADGRWSLPGGWADVGYTPKEIVVKEFKEETGLDVTPERLLAVFDKRMHPYPPQPFYVYKFVFLCSATSFVIRKGFDVLDVQYFSIDALPQLSEDRILESQLQLLHQKIITGDTDVYVD
jgi:ADP-ribose pyrophosphatase YjhB (NUDIX family)